jgi:hypothetical protein
VTKEEEGEIRKEDEKVEEEGEISGEWIWEEKVTKVRNIEKRKGREGGSRKGRKKKSGIKIEKRRKRV